MSPRTAAAPTVPAARSMIYLGMDVHKDSITSAVLPQSAKTPTRLEKLANDLPKLKRWMERVAREGEIHACYEANGAGYVLHRALAEWGYARLLLRPAVCAPVCAARICVRRPVLRDPRGNRGPSQV